MTAAQRLFQICFGCLISQILVTASVFGQNPIDLPIFNDMPADSFEQGAPSASWGSENRGDNLSIRAATGLDMAAHLSLRLGGQGFGLQASFLQRLIGILSAAQSVEFQRWQLQDSEKFESELRASLGFYFSPVNRYLFEPFVHLKGGYETWQSEDLDGSNPVAGHDIGLMIKMTPNFWLTLVRSDLYYGKTIERSTYRRMINDRHYASAEAYFTLAF